MKKYTTLVLVLFFFAGNLLAQIGSVDTTYYKGMGSIEQMFDVLVMQDSSIIVAGAFKAQNQRTINYINKLKPDGSNDYSFNPGTGLNSWGRVLRRQSDGKIIVGGDFTTYNGTSRGRLARIDSTGALDGTFTIGTGFNNSVFDVYVQADSKIVVTGSFTTFNGTTVGGIVRLNTDGSRDTSFHSGTGGNSEIHSVDRASDGTFIIGGNFTSFNGTTVNRIAKLNSDGSLNTTYNSGGAGANVIVYDALFLPNGKVIAAGNFTTYNGATATRIVRLKSNGTMDSTFTSGTGFNALVAGLTLETNGKILATGQFSAYNGTSLSRIARLDSAGTRDTTFMPGGGFDNLTYNSIVAPDNKIYVVGGYYRFDNRLRLFLTRLNTNGSIDPTFWSESKLNNSVEDAAFQSNGKLIIGGNFTYFNNTSLNRIARMNSDGTMDTTFQPGTGANSAIRAVYVLSNDKILIGGDFTSYNGTSINRIARLNSNGSLDTSFHIGTGANASVYVLSASYNGKIYAGGNFTSINGTAKNRLVGLNSDGSIDASFNIGTGCDGIVYDIKVQSDSKLLVGGAFTSYNSVTYNRLLRLDTLAAVDGTFTIGTGANNDVRCIAFDKNGKVFIGGGFTTYNGASRTRLVKLQASGLLDSTFNANIYFGSGSSVFVNSILPYNNCVLAGGNFDYINGVYNSAFGAMDSVGGVTSYFTTGTGVSAAGANIPVLLRDTFTQRILVGGTMVTMHQLYLGFSFIGLKGAYDYGTVAIDSVQVPTVTCTNMPSKVRFKNLKPFIGNNAFTVQLSDSSGSFSSPVTIATKTAVGVVGWDSVAVVIPSNTLHSTHYKVRVLASNPVYLSNATGYFTINVSPAAPTAPAAQSVCSDTALLFTFSGIVSGAGGDSVQWSLNSNFASYNQGGTPLSINHTVGAFDKDTIWIRSYANVTGCVSSYVTTTASNIIPQVPMLPVSQTAWVDTAFTFVFQNITVGNGGNKIEWALNSDFTGSLFTVSPADITLTVDTFETDTLWFRSKDTITGCYSEKVWITATVKLPLVDGATTDTIIAFDDLYNLISEQQLRKPEVGNSSLLMAQDYCEAGYFNIYFTDNLHVGFMDDMQGADRREVVCQVFKDIAKMIKPYNSTIRVNVVVGPVPWSPSPTGSALAHASSIYIAPTSVQNIGIVDGQVYRAINTGVDPYHNIPSYSQYQIAGTSNYIHGMMDVNWNAVFYSHLDLTGGGPSPSQHDLYSVLLHEALHMLGVTAMMIENGTGGMPGRPTLYSRFDTKLCGPSPGYINLLEAGLSCYSNVFDQNLSGVIQDYTSSTSCGNLNFNGNGFKLPVYAPATWQQGSSLNHFDPACGPSLDYVMEAAHLAGASGVKRFPLLEEGKVLCDLGYVFNVSGSQIQYGEILSGITAQNVSTDYDLCTTTSIVGTDDFYSFTVGNTPIPTPFSLAGGILSNDIGCGSGQSIDYECLELLNPGAGTIGPASGNLSTSITFTPNPGFTGACMARYIPVCNGLKGAVTYIFMHVSKAGSCTALTCSPEDCNLVCGGDFEHVQNVTDLRCLYSYFVVNNNTSNSPDLIVDNIYHPTQNSGYSTFTNTACNSSGCVPGSIISPAPAVPYPHDYPTGHKYVFLGKDASIYREAITLPLTQSMVAGRTYTISFMASQMVDCNAALPVIDVFGSTNPPCAYTQPGAFFWSPGTTLCPGSGLTYTPIQIQLGTDISYGWNLYSFNYTPPVNQSPVNFISLAINGACGAIVGIDDVVVTSHFEVSANAGVVDCEDYAAQLNATVAGVVSDYSYEWSPTGTLSDNDIANPIATPTVTTTYTVTVSNSCEDVTATVTVTVDANCCMANNEELTTTENQALTFQGPVTSTQFLAQIATQFSGNVSGTVLSDFFSVIAINSTITLDADLTFVNCTNLQFGPNGRILNSGNHTLSVQGSVLKSCGDYMWKGLEASSSNSFINIDRYDGNSTEIYDAERGVLLHDGGHANINGCSFIDDWIGVETVGMPNGNDFIVTDCFFNATGTLKITSLNLYGSSYTDIGVYINNTNSNIKINIGDINAGYNRFRSLNCGIRSLSSSINVVNNTFTVSQTAPTNANNQYWGCGIYSRTPTAHFTYKDFGIKIGEQDVERANDFTSARIGVDHFGLARNGIDVLFNRFTNGVVNTAIQISAATSLPVSPTPITIHDNYISSFFLPVGIKVAGCSYSAVEINNNNLQMTTTSANTATAQQSVGILALSYAHTIEGSDGISIFDNTIANAQLGIKTFDCRNTHIYNNSITINPRPCSIASTNYWAGIENRYSRWTTVSSNLIELAAGTTAPVYNNSNSNKLGKLSGILSEVPMNISSFSCNEIIGMHWAIAAAGPTAGPVAIQTNQLTNAEVGVVIHNAGMIGNQGSLYYPHDNKWDNCSYELGCMNADGANQQFYLRNYCPSAPSDYYPSTFLQSSIGAFFFPSPIPSLTSVCPTTCQEPGDAWNLINGGDESWYEYLAAGPTNFGWNRREYQNWIKEQLFVMIDENPDMRSLSSTLNDFYEDNENESFAKLMKVNNEMVLLTETQNEDATYLNDDNDFVTPISKRESYLKTVNNIYLNRFATGNYDLDYNELASIEYIANQCYVTGGPAVFKARAMYWLSTNSAESVFWDDCWDQSSKKENEESTVYSYGQKVEIADSTAFDLYPNLIKNNGYFTAYTSAGGTIWFYDLLGKLVYERKIEEGSNRFDCSQFNCGNNMLIYQARLNNGKIKTGKVIILK